MTNLDSLITLRLDFPKVTISWGLGRAFLQILVPKHSQQGTQVHFVAVYVGPGRQQSLRPLEYSIDDLGTEDRKDVTASVTEEAGKCRLRRGCWRAIRNKNQKPEKCPHLWSRNLLEMYPKEIIPAVWVTCQGVPRMFPTVLIITVKLCKPVCPTKWTEEVVRSIFKSYLSSQVA